MNQGYQISYEIISKTKEVSYTNLTCLLVMKNQVRIKTNEQHILLREGDFFFINMNERIEETAVEEGAKVFKLSISNIYLLKHYEDFLASKFNCHSLLTDSNDSIFIEQIKHNLFKLILNYFSGEQTKYLKSSIYLQKILLVLVEQFKVSVFNDQTFKYNEKLNEVFEYVYTNYKQPITLGDVAQKNFMSPSTLSRMFQEQTGVKFNTYINQLRIQMSLNDLLYTQDSIDRIAINYGFSNSKTYRTQFSRFFSCSPTEYKKNFYKKEGLDIQINEKKELMEIVSDEDLDLLHKFMEYKPETSYLDEPKPQKAVLQIDSVHIRPQIHSDIIIHVNSLEDLFLEEVKNQIIKVKKEINCQYIGIQQLFKGTPSSYKVFEQTKLSVYSPFSRFDPVIEFLKANELGIYYQISLKEFTQVTSFYTKESQGFLKHIDYMTRNEFLPNWRVSVQLEKRDLVRSIKSFHEIRTRLKAINEKIQVGASIPIGYPDYRFETKEDEELFKRKVLTKAEFLSYNSEPNYLVDGPDLSQFDLFVSKDIQKIKGTLKSWGVELPLVLSEWNTLTGSSRYTNSYYFRPALIVQEILKLDLLVDSYGFWLNVYLFEESHPSIEAVKYDGLEVFHYYSCPRPVFFALSLYKRLKGNVIATGRHFILTATNGYFQLLTWNAQYFSPNLSKQEVHLKNKALELTINSSNVPNGPYQIRKLMLTKDHGAIAYAYDHFTSQEILDEEARRYLSRITHPKMELFDEVFTDGLKLNCYLEANDVCLFELQKIN